MKKLLAWKYAGDLPFFIVNIGLLAYLWVFHDLLTYPDTASSVLLSVIVALHIFLKTISLRAKADAYVMEQASASSKTRKIKLRAEKYWPEYGVSAANISLIFFFNPASGILAAVIILSASMIIVVGGMWMCPSGANNFSQKVLTEIQKKKKETIIKPDQTNPWPKIRKIKNLLVKADDYLDKFLLYQIKDYGCESVLARLATLGRAYFVQITKGISMGAVMALTILIFSPFLAIAAFLISVVAMTFSVFYVLPEH